MIIQDRDMISAIIDYLDLPLSKKADELRYYGRHKAFICYNIYEDNYQSINIDLSIDITVTYFGNIVLEVFSFDKPSTELRLEKDNFRVTSGLNAKGRLEYDPLYIPSLD